MIILNNSAHLTHSIYKCDTKNTHTVTKHISAGWSTCMCFHVFVPSLDDMEWLVSTFSHMLGCKNHISQSVVRVVYQLLQMLLAQY